MHHVVTRASVMLAVLGLSVATALAQTPAPSSELDSFMKQVLARRDLDRATLQQYILDDNETFAILGPGRVPLHRGTREYTWFVRDGVHVRSPVRFDGVRVGEADRRTYEEDWLRRERERLERRKKREAGRGASDEEAVPDAGVGGDTPIAAPRFVSEAYFMEFKFEPGNYYLAGREQIDGKAVLRIEYYPTRMFNDGDREQREERGRRSAPPRRSPSDRERQQEQELSRKMNKTALITLWVDPAEHQIVKYTFDNVWLDFLPGAWLVRVDDIHASMSMGQPFPGVWLPREMNVSAGVSLASGAFNANYARQFTNYKLAEVKSIIRVPKGDHPVQGSRVQGSGVLGSGVLGSGSGFGELAFNAGPEVGGPWAADEDPVPGQQAEVVREIRVHGNAAVADAEVLSIAGLTVGQPLDPEALGAIEQRLKDSGRFESVEVRKRYRSLTDASDVAIVLVVHERPGVTSMPGVPGLRRRPFGRVTDRLMFLPIVNYADGYGLSYGGRVSTRDLLGAGEHLSVPLTWGGTRRAALEFTRPFQQGPLTRLTSSIEIRQRENPRFELDDRRFTWQARAERHVAGRLRTGVEVSRSAVHFGGVDDGLWTLGADAVLDTRADPAFPRNAMLLGAAWSGLHFRERPERIDRYSADARGYLGLIRQAVIAARVHYTAASATVPAYERLLLGGAESLRGFRAGAFDGDRSLTTSLELRVPVTSVLSSARLGVVGFVDAAQISDTGTRRRDAPWHSGIGAGVFLIAPLITLNLDVAHGRRDGDTRLHLAAGFAF